MDIALDMVYDPPALSSVNNMHVFYIAREFIVFCRIVFDGITLFWITGNFKRIFQQLKMDAAFLFDLPYRLFDVVRFFVLCIQRKVFFFYKYRDNHNKQNGYDYCNVAFDCFQNYVLPIQQKPVTGLLLLLYDTCICLNDWNKLHQYRSSCKRSCDKNNHITYQWDDFVQVIHLYYLCLKVTETITPFSFRWMEQSKTPFGLM